MYIISAWLSVLMGAENCPAGPRAHLPHRGPRTKLPPQRPFPTLLIPLGTASVPVLGSHPLEQVICWLQGYYRIWRTLLRMSRKFLGGPVAEIPCSQCRGPGFNLSGQGTRSHTPLLRVHLPRQRSKIPGAAIKTWHSQTNK